MDRRCFLSQLGKMAAASGAALAATSEGAEGPPGAAAPMPTIPLGEHRVTRLIVGSNPINGYSYLGPHMDRHMSEYFTVDRTTEFLLSCERAGINTHQFSGSASGKAEAILRKVRERGSRMKFICLHSERGEIKQTIDKMQPIAMVHHGGVTDRLFSEGKGQQVHDYVKAVHDEGLLAGVSAHNPDCIRRIADEGWENDFFMACFYFLTRKLFHKSGEQTSQPETLEINYPFYRNDPTVMTRVIRQVQQPCLGFKILAAGRMCAEEETVRNAFRLAFEGIKPTDGVIVGMYPRFFDEVSANARYAREFARAAS
jgi:hypothetical protein